MSASSANTMGEQVETASVQARVESVRAEVESLMHAASDTGKGGQLVQAADRIMEQLKRAGLAYTQRIHSEHVGVHPANRYGQGVQPSEVHGLMEDIINLGWSWAKVAQATCIEVPAGPLHGEYERFNQDLAAGSDGQLAPVQPGALRYLSLSAGHTNQGLRAAHFGVKSESTQLADNGHMCWRKIQSRDPEMGKAISEGLNWTTLARQVEEAFPGLVGMLQEALNASDQVHRSESELEVTLKIHQLAMSQVRSKGEVDWPAVVAAAGRSKPQCSSDIPQLAAFAQMVCGGTDAQLLKGLMCFVKSLKTKRTVRGEVFNALAQTTTGATTTCALFRVACLKACYACPDRFVQGSESRLLGPGDISSMATRNRAVCLQSEHMMKEARALLAQLPEGSLQDLQATHLLGQLDTRLVMHVFQKKDPTRKTFKALSEIGAAFWEDLCSRIGEDKVAGLTWPWPVLGGTKASGEGKQRPASSQSQQPMRELTATGELANPVALLTEGGIVPGARVRNREHGHELEIIAVTASSVTAKEVEGNNIKPIDFVHDDFVERHTVIRHVTREDSCQAA